MKTRNILLVILAVIATVSLSSFLPGPKEELRKVFERSPETRANTITTIMKNRLDLNEKQAEEAYWINLKYAQKLQPIVEKRDKQSWPSEIAQTLNQERKEELWAILTSAQQKKVDQIRKQWITRLEYALEKLKEEDNK